MHHKEKRNEEDTKVDTYMYIHRYIHTSTKKTRENENIKKICHYDLKCTELILLHVRKHFRSVGLYILDEDDKEEYEEGGEDENAKKSYSSSRTMQD
jgi:hypothetical protein